MNLEFTHYCHLNGPSLAQKIHCDKILFSHTRIWYQFLFLSFFLSFFLYLSFLCYVMLCYLFCYYKFLQWIVVYLLFFLIFIFIIINIIIILINQFFFIKKNLLIFHVPECSMFRVLSTPFVALGSFKCHNSWQPRKRRMKTELTFFQCLSWLFQLTYFVKCKRTLLELNFYQPYPSS